MPRYLHIPHTPDTARTLTLSSRNCLVVSGIVTPFPLMPPLTRIPAPEAAPTTTGGRRSVNLSRQQIINIDYATVHILDDDSCGRDRWLHKNG